MAAIPTHVGEIDVTFASKNIEGVLFYGENSRDHQSVVVVSVVTDHSVPVLRNEDNINDPDFENTCNNNDKLDRIGIGNNAYLYDLEQHGITDNQGKEAMYSNSCNLKRRHEEDVLKNGHYQDKDHGNIIMEMTMDSNVNHDEDNNKRSGSAGGDEEHKADDNVRPICNKCGSITAKEIIGLMVKLLVCLICGIIMGIALEKGRVFEPRTIRCQFTYQLWIMMKMFLSAVATGLFCLATLSVIPITKSAFHDARSEYISCLTTKGVLTATIGGTILGAGMALSGACPGMVLSQVGAWIGHGSGLVTFVGCLGGAFSYGAVHPYVSGIIGRRSPYEKQLIDSWISRVPFAVLACGLAAFMTLLVVGLEFWKPWKTEILPSPSVDHIATWFMNEYAWPPYLSGILIGCLQVPLVLFIKDTIGGSSSYCTIVSQLLVTKRMEEVIPYLAKFKRGLSSWWQVFFVSGVIIGAMVSSVLSHTIAEVDGVGWAMSFIGGFLMLFGARLGGGCTSGHGLSGIGVLAVVSFVAVTAMFGGGTIVGVIGWSMGKTGITDEFCPL